MTLAEAKAAVDQILNEECQRPKIQYEPELNETESASDFASITQLTRAMKLGSDRSRQPRAVTESPQLFKFSGETFTMLVSVCGSCTEEDRAAIVEHVVKRVKSGGTRTFPKTQQDDYPTFQGFVCELPLVAEFCVRTGNVELLFTAAASPAMPSVPLAIMMIGIQDLIALNWNQFSNDELERIPKWLDPLRRTAALQTWSKRRSRASRDNWEENSFFNPGYEAEATQIVRSIESIAAECAQARYWHLRSTLLATVNLEIESDKAKVESFLKKLGFNKDLIEVLDAAEKDYKLDADRFELKNCLGHLRSFLEQLHWQAANGVGVGKLDVARKWGSSTRLLCENGFFTRQHEAFTTSLYTLLSDEGVHPLGANQEYARLLRNVVIEYGVMFLAMLDKKGVRLS